MTPHRNTRTTAAGERVETGSLVIDVRLKGLGRIRGATGIQREAAFNLYRDALREMAKESTGRAWIRSLQRDELTHLDLWAVYKDGRWQKAPEAAATGQLVTALINWREEAKDQVADATYVGRKHLITQVRAATKSLKRPKATIDELPRVFLAVRRRMLKAPASFNQIRNYLRAFLRDTVGTRHELYQVIKHDIGAIKIPGHAKKKALKHRPLTPAQVLLLASKFPTRYRGGAEGAPGHGYNAIQMALTGMNPKEYFVDGWTQLIAYVEVHGDKREGRERKVPRLFPSALWPHLVLKQPVITKHSFERAFAEARRAAKLDCTPMDLRRSFANWMEQAKIERTRRRLYMGHGPRDVTDLYETQELLQHLREDGRALVAWIAQQLQRGPQLVVEEASRG